MNVIVPSVVAFEDLIKLAQEKGLAPVEVVEASLYHVSVGCTDTQLNMVIASKFRMLEEDVRQEGMTPINAAELFMTGLPGHLNGLVVSMIEYGVMDAARAAANWDKLEEIILETQPDEFREFARKRREARQADTTVKS